MNQGKITFAICSALFIGWFIRGCFLPVPKEHQHNKKQTGKAKKKKVVWTCSMHPQIKLPKAGLCPICHMDLIPLKTGAASSKVALTLSKSARKLAEIQTTKVRRQPIFFELRLNGKISFNERQIKHITAWTSGRLERLYVDYTGVRVRKGDHLVKIYSPELVTAQQELLQAKKASNKASHAGTIFQKIAKRSLSYSREKLKLLGLKSWQINRLEKSGKVENKVNIYSPIEGTVIRKSANEGSYVKTGETIYTIANFKDLWVTFDVYEKDHAFLRLGQKIRFTVEALPGQFFETKTVYISPILNPTTRTYMVRGNIPNPKGLLKPHMFVKGRLFVSLDNKGVSDTSEEQPKWVCPMHAEEHDHKKRRCKICGMNLERQKRRKGKNKGTKDPIVIPVTAPLLTGKRAIVYVVSQKKKNSLGFTLRQVVLGTKVGKFYIVKSGLKVNEEIVSFGTFRIDSELQLQGKKSMMSLYAHQHQQKHHPKLRKGKVFYQQKKKLFSIYFQLQDALRKDQQMQSQKLLAMLKKFSLKRQKYAKEAWKYYRKKWFLLFENHPNKQQIAAVRKTFFSISKLILEMENHHGHWEDKTYYLAHCPMARSNQGASWLQTQKTLFNPYFGKKMLHCGTVKKTFLSKMDLPFPISRHFLKKLSPLYTSYLKLQQLLFKDKSAKKHIQRLHKQVQRLLSFKYYLPRKRRKKWLFRQRQLQKALSGTNTTTKQIRATFWKVSKELKSLLKLYGHHLPFSLHEAYCPMAFGYKGAFWFQQKKTKVENSYFGAKMAHCGSFKKTYAPRTKMLK